MEKKCCIVIPTYKEYDNLSSFEKKSMNNTILKMSNWDIILICPNKINIDGYKNNGILRIIRFDDRFFKSVNAYNEMMLSTFFYE
jgi:hypothetical protein